MEPRPDDKSADRSSPNYDAGIETEREAFRDLTGEDIEQADDDDADTDDDADNADDADINDDEDEDDADDADINDDEDDADEADIDGGEDDDRYDDPDREPEGGPFYTDVDKMPNVERPWGNHGD